MAKYFRGATSLTGGGEGALDAFDGLNLKDGEGAIAITQLKALLYYLNATSGEAESSPNIIAPDTHAGDKRWHSIPIGTRTATLVVAANDSSAKSKAQADYVCDGTADEVEIQAAIDALPDGIGGKVLLLEGLYVVENIVVIDVDNVTLEGTGKGTVLRLKDNASGLGNIIRVIESENWTIRDIAFDGNIDNQDTSEEEPPPYPEEMWCAIWLQATNSSIIEDCYFKDVVNSGVRIGRYTDIETAAHDNIVTGCSFDNCRTSVLIFGAVPYSEYNNTIISNVSRKHTGYGAFYVYGPKNLIIGNQALEGQTASVSDGIRLVFSDYCIVTGNIVADSAYIGIRLHDSDSCIVTSNICYNNTDWDIYITGTTINAYVMNNRVSLARGINKSYSQEFSRVWNVLPDHFQDCLALSTTTVHAAITGTGAEQEITTAITNPDVPRNISITNSANSTGDVTITGVDAKGNSITEDITIVTGGTAYGDKAFATVSKITILAGVANPDTIEVGVSDKLGLSNIIYATGDVYKVKVNNADATGQFDMAADVDVTNGTLDMSSLTAGAIGAGDDITIYYRSNLNIIS